MLDWTGAPLTSVPDLGSDAGISLARRRAGGGAWHYGAPTTTLVPTNAAANLPHARWIDNTHLLSGGDAQHQPSVGNITTGQVIPVAALGDCAGRIPGGL